jgi:hypothetical protein
VIEKYGSCYKPTIRLNTETKKIINRNKSENVFLKVKYTISSICSTTKRYYTTRYDKTFEQRTLVSPSVLVRINLFKI